MRNTNSVNNGESVEKNVESTVESFFQQANIYPPFVSDIRFHENWDEFRNARGKHVQKAVKIRQKDRDITIDICREGIRDIPATIINGWLKHELAECVIRLQPELYEVHFQDDIFPQFPVYGSAIDIVQQILHHIKRGLHSYMATTLAVSMGMEKDIYNYFQFIIHPSREDMRNYGEMFPHAWIRAIFLCQKLGSFLSSKVLSQMDSVSPDLHNQWWDCHKYIADEDQELFFDFAHVLDQPMEKKDEVLTREMFSIVKTRLLVQPEPDDDIFFS
jgi:hypothetical protein